MRSHDEMMELILNVAREDENIRSVLMVGSRANPDCPRDPYQDFDVCYFVREVKPYWDNMAWIESKFGKPSLVQKPDAMQLVPPDGDSDGDFMYLMIFPDGNRIDLQVTENPYVDDGEPAVLLLDKDGNFPDIAVNPAFWHVQKPDRQFFADCCNEFHWCLNNFAKGLARDELPYAMEMLNRPVRDMLNQMLKWHIGADYGFAVSPGKGGKYFKKFLPAELYEQLLRTYPSADPAHMWEAAFKMLRLFGKTARHVAGALSYPYDEDEERGIAAYMEQVRSGALER